ncbi:MAG: hypothetical protein ACJA0N_002376 [Pseudohongiellaceae bacterium]|jgi:hypothetical protein
MVGPTQVIFNDKEVESTFKRYPSTIVHHLIQLRKLVFETASELGLDDIEETLKWGEPSYLSKNGSTLRIAWRASKPNQYAILFNCKTRLIETFKEVYQDTFTFEANRAITFNKGDNIPTDAIKHCIGLALTYHKVKHLPLLGV